MNSNNNHTKGKKNGVVATNGKSSKSKAIKKLPSKAKVAKGSKKQGKTLKAKPVAKKNGKAKSASPAKKQSKEETKQHQPKDMWDYFDLDTKYKKL